MRHWLIAAAISAMLQGAAVAAPPAGSAVPPADIVVNAARTRPSGWREASSAHVVVLSDGSEADLVRLTRNLERLHFLLSGLLGRPYEPDDKVRLRVTLIGDVAEFEAMDLRNVRWQQGPFNDRFQITRYYDPRQDGAVMATTRVDQRTVIELTPANAHSMGAAITGMAQSSGMAGSDPGAQAAFASALVGDFATAGMVGASDLTPSFGEHAIDVPAESLLYAGYAQHYLQTYFPAAYPRWYLDGFGEIFASFATMGDHELEFGRSPKGAGAVLDEFGGFPIADIFNDKYLTETPHKTGWTPIHAWLLTHFLFFSDKRRPQLRRYLKARATGADPASAAAVFGDQKQLARELRAYYGAKKPYEQVTYNPAVIDEPVVRRLSEGEAAFIKGRLELGARILVPPAAPAGAEVPASYEKARDAALRARDAWLKRLREEAARYSRDLSAQLLLAEAECRSGNGAECLAAADRANRLNPGDPRPFVWKGLAMAQLAAGLPAHERAERLAAAQATIASANHLNNSAIEPLLAYFESFVMSGEPPSVNAIDALQEAVEEVPNAPESRLALAGALADRGQAAVARAIVLPVAIGAYDSPERGPARALLAKLPAGGTNSAASTP